MDIKIKRILITGGAGFLGSHLCESMLASGAQVICVDNLASGSLKNIVGFLHHPRFQFLRHDISLPLAVDEIDEIYNLACPASPVQYQKDPVQTLKSSVYGAVNMLDLCLRSKARILQTSTSEIYGNPAVHPQPESYFGNVNPIGLRACYDEGKRAAETLFFDYHRQFGARIKIARLFNSFGPRMQMHDGRVIPNFILQALQNQPITIQGDGSQTRSFCYVSDTLRALTLLMATGDHFHGPLNIGNTHEISVLELAELVIEMTGASSMLVFNPGVADDPERRKPDITLAAQVLQWQPEVSLQEGLQHTIAYFEDMLRNNSALFQLRG